MITVLLTDGEFTGLIRSLREGFSKDVRIVGLSTDPNAPHQMILDAFHVVSEHDADGYIDELIDILKEENVDIIFPIVTESLEKIMENETLILEKTGARIISTPLPALYTANDKGLLYSFLKSCPDPVLVSIMPLFYLADTKAELFAAVRKIQSEDRTACIKRRRGEDAIGFWVIDDTADYASLLFFRKPERVLSEKMLANMLENVHDEDRIPGYVVCEYLSGEEWDCDVLCKNGILISVTTRISLCMDGGFTSVLEVRENPYLAKCCRHIVAALGLSYVVCISFRSDGAGHFFLLEINPRMMGNVYVSFLAGNNYAKMAIDLLGGKTVNPKPPKTGIKTAQISDQLLIGTQSTDTESMTCMKNTKMLQVKETGATNE